MSAQRWQVREGKDTSHYPQMTKGSLIEFDWLKLIFLNGSSMSAFSGKENSNLKLSFRFAVSKEKPIDSNPVKIQHLRQSEIDDFLYYYFGLYDVFLSPQTLAQNALVALRFLSDDVISHRFMLAR